ncbi:uncharacterized protein LOC118421908 [Branchiostoma floridae]|uniref:Uncharacterized protein LOC118421908 n=1 Tax=Branchiostoma floridae TaxID=7739 RepID=A0A9J7N0F4_BRAFL|nr:uncharacterized protein LOC118421908 [Branchiostoma floridae]
MPDVDGSPFAKYIFPFENLVLEGGGAKGAAYVGALKVLDEAGILKNIKRFGGTSAGSITAGFLAVGMTPQDILDKINEDLGAILLDSPWYLCGCCKYLWYFNNLENHYGIFPAERFVKWYGDAIEEHLRKMKRRQGVENPKQFDSLKGDITFAEVYEAFGKELCTVSYETEFSSEVYSHVKTSPLLEIREAVRMSMSIPVVFEAYKPPVGQLGPPARHVDGGVSANYPIYCFEGWWLSMEEQNTFANRLDGLNGWDLAKNFRPDVSREHFRVEGSPHEQKAIREKTLGSCLFTDTQPADRYQHQFEDRTKHFVENHPQYKRMLERPNTKLGKEYGKRDHQLQQDRDKFSKELDNDRKLENKIMRVAEACPNKAEMECRFATLTPQETIQIYGKNDPKAAFKMLFLNYKDEPTTTLALDIFHNEKPLQAARNRNLKGSFANTPLQLYSQLAAMFGKNLPMQVGVRQE